MERESSGTRAPPLYISHVFDTPTNTLYAVQDYALSIGKSVKVGRRGGTDRRIVCTSQSCGFFVQCYRHSSVKSGTRTWGHWYISSLNLEHMIAYQAKSPSDVK